MDGDCGVLTTHPYIIQLLVVRFHDMSCPILCLDDRLLKFLELVPAIQCIVPRHQQLKTLKTYTLDNTN